MRILFPFLLTLAAAALLVFIPTSKSQEELNIHETLFRYEINQRQQPAGPCYLSINEKAPSTAFMRHFKWLGHPVKKISECKLSSDGVVDKETGAEGFTLTTGRVRWISDTEVEISCEFFANGLNADGWICHLKKSVWGWQVTQHAMKWIA